MKKLFTALMLVAVAYSASAQVAYNNYQHEGYYIDKDGKKVEGVIEVYADADRPWVYQDDIKFIPKEAFQQKKVKGKDKTKLGPKDIQGYGFNDRFWSAQKVSDVSAVGTNMIPRMRFVEQLVSGKISVFKFHPYPDTMGTPQSMDESKARCKDEYQIKVYKEGDKKVRDSESINMMEFIGDCESVLKQYKEGAYGFTPKSDDEKKGLSKMVAGISDKMKQRNAMVQIATDYNNCK